MKLALLLWMMTSVKKSMLKELKMSKNFLMLIVTDIWKSTGKNFRFEVDKELMSHYKWDLYSAILEGGE